MKKTATVYVLALIAMTWTLTNCATSSRPTELRVSSRIHQPQKFASHRGSGPMQNYLAQNVDEQAVATLRVELENRIQKKLSHRNEAHLTVITPVEYDKALSKKLKMEDIDALAEKMNIQAAKFKPVCLGRGSLTIQGAEQSTYYLVIDSEASFRLRKAVQDLFVARGGKADAFNPDHFYPHITVAYTQRDLHYEDGIVKDERSCIFAVKEDKE